MGKVGGGWSGHLEVGILGVSPQLKVGLPWGRTLKGWLEGASLV